MGGVSVSIEPNSSADPTHIPQDTAGDAPVFRAESSGGQGADAPVQGTPSEPPATESATASDVAAAANDQPPVVNDLPADEFAEAANAVAEAEEVEAEEDDVEEEEEEVDYDVKPLEFIDESIEEEEIVKAWYILKVQVNREESIRDALLRRIKLEGQERYFGEIVVPTEDVAEFNKSGKRRIVKRKLYPGYIMVNMKHNDPTWYLVRDTPGIGDFTGSAGKPTPMEPRDIERILQSSKPDEDHGGQIKTTIPFKPSDRVRVKEGYFQNFEGDVESIDEANGRITVMINIFGRSTPVELEHWQVEAV
jgi:transcriptional antiterminator NusG